MIFIDNISYLNGPKNNCQCEGFTIEINSIGIPESLNQGSATDPVKFFITISLSIHAPKG
ncbi:hypothetical protein BpHYR1_005215 [Brachionus plicatilis]|uniref:Uncharacterized protein n=1 Tax=Brachionus plicatilis TaxID=10195 RepID=A0A3M7RNI2_BRAPC|nr:hypothetical protein BpHYR1_005215 [Brachionus plicatilis]